MTMTWWQRLDQTVNKRIMDRRIGTALDAAADYMHEHGWARRELETDDGRVCLLGAIREAVIYDDMPYAQERLRLYLCDVSGDAWTSIPSFNDTVCKTKQEAVMTLRAAARWEGACGTGIA
jgi:hypothetical protein